MHKSMFTIENGMNCINILFKELNKINQLHKRLTGEMAKNKFSLMLCNLYLMYQILVHCAIDIQYMDNVQGDPKAVECITF